VGVNGKQETAKQTLADARQRQTMAYPAVVNSCWTRAFEFQQQSYTFFFLGFFVSFLRSMLFAIGQILPSPRLWPVLGRRVEYEFQGTRGTAFQALVSKDLNKHKKSGNPAGELNSRLNRGR
jgi:hypothetical protein